MKIFERIFISKHIRQDAEGRKPNKKTITVAKKDI